MKKPDELIGYIVKDYRSDESGRLKNLILKDPISGDIIEIWTDRDKDQINRAYLKIVIV